MQKVCPHHMFFNDFLSPPTESSKVIVYLMVLHHFDLLLRLDSQACYLCGSPNSLVLCVHAAMTKVRECLLLRVIRKKSDSGVSPELRSGPSVFSLSRVTERGEYRMGCSGHALGLSFLYFSFSACSGAPSPGLPLNLSLSSGLFWAPLAGSGLFSLSVFFYAKSEKN